MKSEAVPATLPRVTASFSLGHENPLLHQSGPFSGESLPYLVTTKSDGMCKYSPRGTASLQPASCLGR
jgi:hypothetical protein